MTKLNTGDKKVVTVPAKDAYGEHKEASVFQNIPRDRFPEGNLPDGLQFLRHCASSFILFFFTVYEG